MSFLNKGISRTHVAAVAGCALAMSTLSPLGHAQQKTPANDPPIVIRWRNYTVLSKSDISRLSAIQSAIYSRHTITDDDLNFALNKLKAEPVVRKGNHKLELQCMVLTSLTGRKDFTKLQVSRFLQAVVPFASSANSGVASYAAIALCGLRDARVIPILEKIVQNTNSKSVRHHAAGKLPRLKQLAAAGKI